MQSNIFLLIIVLFGWNSATDGSPVGAPTAACTTMIPQHGVPFQERDCPFEIVLDKTDIKPNEMLTIRLQVKDSLSPTDPAIDGFKGFMVMAFDATGVDIEPIGMFHTPTSTDIRTMDCPSSSGNQQSQVGVTHTSNSLKKSIEVLWMPPDGYIGPVIIMTTFVQEKATFWVKETSRHVNILPDEVTTTTTTTTKSSTSGSTGSSTITSTSTSSPITPTPTPSPGTGSRVSYSAVEWIVLSCLVVLSYCVDSRI